MLDERDYCAINVNRDVELFKPKQKMSYPKLNCFLIHASSLITNTHTD